MKKARIATPEKRFIRPVSDAQMAVVSKGYVPPNTKKNTDWTVTCFREWRSARNRNITKDDKCWCPEDLLEKSSIDKLNYWISRFIAEVRNKKGEPYPTRSIRHILAG